MVTIFVPAARAFSNAATGASELVDAITMHLGFLAITSSRMAICLSMSASDLGP